MAAVASSARRSSAAVAAGTVAAVLGCSGAGVATPGHRQTVRSYWTRGVETRRALRPSHARTNTPVHFRFSGVTSRRQRRQCRGARGPKRRFELALEVQRWTRAVANVSWGPKIIVTPLFQRFNIQSIQCVLYATYNRARQVH